MNAPLARSKFGKSFDENYDRIFKKESDSMPELKDLKDELKKKVSPGDVVQLSPNASNPMFACCLLVVTEVKSFGVQGYVQALGDKGEIGGRAFYRAPWDEFEWIGPAVWIAE